MFCNKLWYILLEASQNSVQYLGFDLSSKYILRTKKALMKLQRAILYLFQRSFQQDNKKCCCHFPLNLLVIHWRKVKKVCGQLGDVASFTPPGGISDLRALSTGLGEPNTLKGHASALHRPWLRTAIAQATCSWIRTQLWDTFTRLVRYTRQLL